MGNVGAKAARSGSGRRLGDSLSALANRTGGLDVHQRQKEITRLTFLGTQATMGPRFPVHKLNGHWA